MSNTVNIYTESGELRATITPVKGSKRVCKLMGDDYALVKFTTPTPIDFAIGDYADIQGLMADGSAYSFGRFEITEKQTPTKSTSDSCEYELKMQAQYKKWGNKVHRFQPQLGGSETSWTLTATLAVHAQQILNSVHSLAFSYPLPAELTKENAVNAQYLYNGKLAWVVVIDDSVSKAAKSVTYDSTNILDAISTLCSENYFDCEYWFEGNALHFGKCQRTDDEIFDAECDFELSEVTPSKSQDKRATRIYAFGSSKNLSSRYRRKLVFTADTVSDTSFLDSTRKLKASWFDTDTINSLKKEGNTLTLPTLAANVSDKTLSASAVLDISTLPWCAARYTMRFASSQPVIEVFSMKDDAQITSLELTFALAGQWLGQSEQVSFTRTYKATSLADLRKFSYSDFEDFSDGVFAVSQDIRYPRIVITLTITLSESTGNESIKCEFASPLLYDVRANNASTVQHIRVTNTITNEEFTCSFSDGTLTSEDNAAHISKGDTYTINSSDLLYGFVGASAFQSRYGDEDSVEVIKNGVVQTLLSLPEGSKPYIDLYEGQSEQQAVEDVVVFDDIYPECEDTVTDIRTVERTYNEDDENGASTVKSFTAWQIRSNIFATRDFSDAYIIDNTTLQITFGDGKRYASGDVRADGTIVKDGDSDVGALINENSGKLNGWTFDVDVKRLPATQGDYNSESIVYFEIVRDSSTDVPNAFLCPQPYDTFTLVNFDTACVDDTLVAQAEQRLQRTAQLYVDALNEDATTFDCAIMSKLFAGQSINKTLATAHANLAQQTRLPYYISASEIKPISNFTQRLYTLSDELQAGDIITISAIIEVQGCDFSAQNAFLQLQLSSALGYVSASQRIIDNGVYFVEKTLSVGSPYDSSNTQRYIYARFDYIKAQENTSGSIRIRSLKCEMGDVRTPYCTTLQEAQRSELCARSATALGARVRLIGAAFFGNSALYRTSRVIGYEMALDLPFDSPKISVGDKARYTRFGKIESDVQALRYSIAQSKSSSAGNIYSSSSTGDVTLVTSSTSSTTGFNIVTSYDESSQPTDANVYSSKRTLQEIARGDVAHATEADRATSALNAEKWDNHDFSDYLNQSVRTTDDVTHKSLTATKSVTAQSVTASESISADTVTANTANIEKIAATQVDAQRIGTQDFTASSVNGSGAGMVMEGGKGNGYFDNVYVREGLHVVTLLIEEVKSVGRAIVISCGDTECATCVGRTSDYKVTDDETQMHHLLLTCKDKNPFVKNDLVRWQHSEYKDGSEFVSRGGWMRVGYVENLYFTLIPVLGESITKANFPQEGDALIQMGNTTDSSRQGFTLITNGESGGSFSVYTGVSTPVLPTVPAYRSGDLSDISDSDFGGALSGMGIYGVNAYLKGKLMVKSADGSKNQDITEYTDAAVKVSADTLSARIEKIDGTEGSVATLSARADEISTSVKDNADNISKLTQDANSLSILVADTGMRANILAHTADLQNAKCTIVQDDGDVSFSAQDNSLEIKTLTTPKSYCVALIPLGADTIAKGKTYTVSFDLTLDIGVSTGYVRTIFATTRAVVISNIVKTALNGDLSQRVVATLTATDASTDEHYLFIDITALAIENRSLEISHIKIENGTTATQWIASSDDISYQSAQIKVNADKISSTVSEQDKRFTSLEQTASSLTSSVQSQDGRITSVEQTADKISAAVKTYDTVLTNLFPTPYWNCRINDRGYFQNNYSSATLTSPTEAGQTVTVRLKGRFASGHMCVYYAYNWQAYVLLYGSQHKEVLAGTRKADYTGDTDDEIIEFSFVSADTFSSDENKAVFVVGVRTADNSIDASNIIKHVIVAQTDNLTLGTLLADTGIDLQAGQITATADNFLVQNNNGTQTLLVTADGKLDARLINTIELTVRRIIAEREASTDDTAQAPIARFNERGDGAFEWFYPTLNNGVAVPMLRISPQDINNVMQYFNEDGSQAGYFGFGGNKEQAVAGYITLLLANLSTQEDAVNYYATVKDYTYSEYALRGYRYSGDDKVYAEANAETAALLSGVFYSPTATEVEGSDSRYYTRTRYEIVQGVVRSQQSVRFTPVSIDNSLG